MKRSLAILLLCAAPILTLAADYQLGLATSRIDYQSIDPAARRLYIAKMGSDSLTVVDLDTNRVMAEFANFPKATGVLVVPDLHRVYVSAPGGGIGSTIDVAFGKLGLSSGNGVMVVLDTDSFKELARLRAGVFPDGIAYDPRLKRIFVSDEKGSAVSVFDAEKNLALGRIDMKGEVGNVRYDPVSDMVYAPVQSTNELAVIDPAALKVTARLNMAGGDHPHGLLLAPGGGIAYVACDGNDRLLAVELSSGRILTALQVAHQPDVMDADLAGNRLFIASESGNLSSFDISNPEKPIPLGDKMIGPGAHSVAVDPQTHLLYFPLADVGGKAVLRVLPSE